MEATAAGLKRFDTGSKIVNNLDVLRAQVADRMRTTIGDAFKQKRHRKPTVRKVEWEKLSKGEVIKGFKCNVKNWPNDIPMKSKLSTEQCRVILSLLESGTISIELTEAEGVHNDMDMDMDMDMGLIGPEGVHGNTEMGRGDNE